MPRPVSVVPHTHWDREWYAPFAAFRMRLVAMLDEFLPELENDPGYRRFLLDGQMAVVDDYLAVRPAARAPLERLAAAGRLSVGPWYVLMDEFCSSGETMVRNLQLGLRRAEDFGGAMAVGYLPDMFGHVAQMPQLLRAAGIEHAVVWRGVPAAVDRTGFWWRAPDGSTVRAEYLPVGYANGAATPHDAGALVRRVAVHDAEVAAFLGSPVTPLLWMNGTDHQAPQPWLPGVVDEANRSQDDLALAISSLPEHLAGAPTDGLPTWAGELRSGARANLLMGVLSNRVDVKVAAARVERALERRTEPLCALWLAGPRWPGDELARAWLEVIRNSAHDSICACSADEVGTAVLERFGEAQTVADGLAAGALAQAASDFSVRGPVVVNASARTRSGVVELRLDTEEAPAGTQLIESVPAGRTTRQGTGADLGRFLGELMAEGWLRAAGGAADLSIGDEGEGLVVRFAVGQRRGADAASTMAEAWARAGAERDRPLRVEASRPGSVRVAARTGPVPGFGWAAWAPPPDDTAAVHADGASMDNGLVRVEVDPSDGTFAVDGLVGLGRLVDGGDEGDTYTYSPPADDTEVDRPESVAVSVVEAGPVRARLAVDATYRWPARLTEGMRTGERVVEVRTELELRAGERLVRVTTSFDNPCRDHRLRAVFPLPQRATGSEAECAFATVRRGLEAEGGPHERPTPTFPSRRFVSAGGLTVTHEGLLEYEVVDAGRALALTLLRATGYLSRPAPAYRPNPAGPALPVEGAQLVGPVCVRYAVAVGADDPYALADDAWLPLDVVTGRGRGSRPASGRHLEVTGAQVSALRRRASGTAWSCASTTRRRRPRS